LKVCTKCRHAKWDRTKTGRLHPSGDGKCGYPYKIPQLPGSKYWISGVPAPYGGIINRRKDLKEDCVYYSV